MFGFIIGPKGETVQRLQKETSTNIAIPRNNSRSRGDNNRNQQNETTIDLEITEPTIISASGPNHRKNLRKAGLRINLILHKNRSKLPYTHYVALNFYKNESFMERKQAFLNQLQENQDLTSDSAFARKFCVIKRSHQTILWRPLHQWKN